MILILPGGSHPRGRRLRGMTPSTRPAVAESRLPRPRSAALPGSFSGIRYDGPALPRAGADRIVWAAATPIPPHSDDCNELRHHADPQSRRLFAITNDHGADTCPARVRDCSDRCRVGPQQHNAVERASLGARRRVEQGPVFCAQTSRGRVRRSGARHAEADSRRCAGNDQHPPARNAVERDPDGAGGVTLFFVPQVEIRRERNSPPRGDFIGGQLGTGRAEQRFGATKGAVTVPSDASRSLPFASTRSRPAGDADEASRMSRNNLSALSRRLRDAPMFQMRRPASSYGLTRSRRRAVLGGDLGEHLCRHAALDRALSGHAISSAGRSSNAGGRDSGNSSAGPRRSGAGA